MRIHDVSLALSDRLPHWPGDPPYRRQLAEALARGDAANVSRIDFGAHTGTHVDAPVHFFEGRSGVDKLPLDVLVGDCRVVFADPPGTELRPEDVTERAERLLIKTRNSGLWARRESSFDRSFVAVGEALARRLVDDGVRLVGVDYLSVERFDAPFAHPVHRLLLDASVVIVEGLDLSRVEPGAYRLFCLPLKIVGSDGGPARVILAET
jgi:arylformamidase